MSRKCSSLFLILVMAIFLGGCFSSKNKLDRFVAKKIEAITEEYSLSNVDYSIEFLTDATYYIVFSANLENIDLLQDCYSALHWDHPEELQFIQTMGNITINGTRYFHSSFYSSENDVGNVFHDGKVVHADAPFCGMDEEYIDNTDLGKHDEVEYCRDYKYLDYDHASKDYIWYSSSGDKIFSAHVLAGKVISIADWRSGFLVSDYNIK